MILFVAAIAVGCGKAPPAADPSKAPWLDPKTQIESLKDEDFRVRGIAAFNLGNLGAKAAHAIPELERLAQNDPIPKVRENAAAALEKLRAASGENKK
jgi:hypothetical protein